MVLYSTQQQARITQKQNSSLRTKKFEFEKDRREALKH